LSNETKQEENKSAVGHDSKKSQEIINELGEILTKHKCTTFDAVLLSKIFADVCFHAHWSGVMTEELADGIARKFGGEKHASLKYVH